MSSNGQAESSNGQVESSNGRAERLNRVFSALADETRRELIRRLTEQTKPGCGLTMSELARDLPMSLAAVSKHVKVLEHAGLVHRQIEGRTHHIRLKTEALAPALDWISIYRNFWSGRFEQLEQSLRNDKSEN